jgi:hypothetical protein
MTAVNRLKRWLVTSGISIAVLFIASFTTSAPSGASTATTVVASSGTTRTTVTPGSGGSCKNTQFRGQRFRPAFVRRTLRALPLQATPSTPDYQPVGVLVPNADIATTASDSNGMLFGLAVFQELATYPAMSTDGGAIWRIDGPPFSNAGADAPAFTSTVGALGANGAYFWGQGGNAVKVTLDEGLHWWIAGFGAGVYKVSASHGTLRTIALGNQVSCTDFQAFLYVSTDSGRIWNFHGQLRDVRL